MKQHITLRQLNELSDKAKERLRDWWKPNEGDLVHAPSNSPFSEEVLSNIRPRLLGGVTYGVKDDPDYKGIAPLLSIGQMIEFLQNRVTGDLDLKILLNSEGSSVWLGIDGIQQPMEGLGGDEDMELCDALWGAVRKQLEHERLA